MTGNRTRFMVVSALVTLVMGAATWVELHQRGLPMRIVFQDPRRVVVVKP